MKRTTWRKIAACAGGAVLLVAFQNCAPSELAFEDLEIASNIAFFSYPYKASPVFYADMALFKPASGVEGLEEFKFVGAAIYVADPTKNVSYQIRIQTPSGTTVCPTETGTLSGGATTIEFDCVSAVATNSVKIRMTVTADGRSELFEWTY